MFVLLYDEKLLLIDLSILDSIQIGMKRETALQIQIELLASIGAI